MYGDLKASGISRAQARKIGCKSKTREETKEETGEYRYSYAWIYADIDDNDTDYCRHKFTSDPLGAFGTMTKKPNKYHQSKGSMPQFYLSRLVDWDPLKDDAEEPVSPCAE